jgi:hypothetical protein
MARALADRLKIGDEIGTVLGREAQFERAVEMGDPAPMPRLEVACCGMGGR